MFHKIMMRLMKRHPQNNFARVLEMFERLDTMETGRVQLDNFNVNSAYEALIELIYVLDEQDKRIAELEDRLSPCELAGRENEPAVDVKSDSEEAPAEVAKKPAAKKSTTTKKKG